MQWSGQLMPIWQIIGPISFAVFIVVGAAVSFHGLIQSSYWRKIVWQVAVLALGVLLLGDFTGQTRNLVRSKLDLAADHSPSIPSLADPGKTLSEKTVNDKSLLSSRGNVGSELDRTAWAVSNLKTGDLVFDSRAETAQAGFAIPMAFWGIVVWMVGTSLLIARLAISRVLLLRLQLKSSPVQHELLSESLKRLRERLGIRKNVKLISSDRIPAPVAFGILNPTVAVPADFVQEYNSKEQQAVLVHELAHLIGRDPLWSLFSDVVAALLWWHPMVWWAHYRLREAMEAVADEATVLVQDGPNALAECLVRLGSRLVGASAPASIPAVGNGFRSGLGRRVEHLLNLRCSTWKQPAAIWSVPARIAGTLLLTLATMASVAWAHPDLEENTTMKTFKQNWKQSFGAMALLVGIVQNDSEVSKVLAQAPINTLEGASQGEAASRNRGQNPAQQFVQPQNPQLANPQQKKPESLYKMDPVLARRYGLIPSGGQGETENRGDQQLRSSIAKKLEEIVVESAHFEEFPLSEVIRRLYELSRASGDEKQGINFLLSNVVESDSNQIDPVTGAPIPALTASSEELGKVIVRLDPPLRNVRLKDLLNAITKVASEPVRYTIEDYGVLFSFDSSRPRNAVPSNPFGVALEVGTFHIEEASLIDGATKVFDIRLDGGGDSRLVARRLVEKLGINTEKPNLFFYNPKTGILMVRATKSELDLIRATIETLIGQSVVPTGKQTEGQKPAAFNSNSPQPPLNGNVSILGEVRNPGNVLLSDGTGSSVLEIIARVGGFSEKANKHAIQLVRDGKKQQFRWNDLLKGNTSESKVQPGDLIIVPESLF